MVRSYFCTSSSCMFRFCVVLVVRTFSFVIISQVIGSVVNKDLSFKAKDLTSELRTVKGSL